MSKKSGEINLESVILFEECEEDKILRKINECIVECERWRYFDRLICAYVLFSEYDVIDVVEGGDVYFCSTHSLSSKSAIFVVCFVDVEQEFLWMDVERRRIAEVREMKPETLRQDTKKKFLAGKKMNGGEENKS